MPRLAAFGRLKSNFPTGTPTYPHNMEDSPPKEKNGEISQSDYIIEQQWSCCRRAEGEENMENALNLYYISDL